MLNSINIETQPKVYVLMRVFCKDTVNCTKFIETLKESIKSIIDNGYEKVMLLLNDDTKRDNSYEYYKNRRDRCINDTMINWVEREENVGERGSAYAMFCLKQFFLDKTEKEPNAIAIILDQDDRLERDAIKHIVERMRPGGIVISPFKIMDIEGLDITDDGGRIHNELCCNYFIPDSYWGYDSQYISNDSMKAVWNFSSIGWTKSYSRSALKQYNDDLKRFILSKREDGLVNYFSEQKAFEDFIDFYVLLLEGINFSTTNQCSHSYIKNKDSITATPNLDDFLYQRTNSLITLIDLCYANTQKLCNDFERKLHRFVASKVYQIEDILSKYRTNYLENGNDNYAVFATKTHEGYLVNKIVRLAMNKNRGTEQDKQLFEKIFTRSSDTTNNFEKLFKKEVFNNITQYNSFVNSTDSKFVFRESVHKEGILRKKKRTVNQKNNKDEQEKYRPQKRNLCSWRIGLWIAIGLFVTALLALVLSFSNLGLNVDKKALGTVVGFFLTILLFVAKEYKKIRDLDEEQRATIKLYYSEFDDFMRHLEANIKVLIQIDKQWESGVSVQNIHFINLKWPTGSILFSDNMPKLIGRDRIDDFSRLKVNIRNINNSADWLMELSQNNRLSQEHVKWEITRHLGYLVNVYYMKEHNFEFATQNELHRYIDEKNIKYKLTELFMDYEYDKRKEKVDYFFNRYFDDRRKCRSVLVDI